MILHQLYEKLFRASQEVVKLVPPVMPNQACETAWAAFEQAVANLENFNSAVGKVADAVGKSRAEVILIINDPYSHAVRSMKEELKVDFGKMKESALELKPSFYGKEPGQLRAEQEHKKNLQKHHNRKRK